MRKLVIVAGLLLMSSQASAEIKFTCDMVMQRADSAVFAENYHVEEANAEMDAGKYSEALKSFAKAKNALEKAGDWASIYIAFCKD